MVVDKVDFCLFSKHKKKKIVKQKKPYKSCIIGIYFRLRSGLVSLIIIVLRLRIRVVCEDF